jgi:hypothetical protein
VTHQRPAPAPRAPAATRHFGSRHPNPAPPSRHLSSPLRRCPAPAPSGRAARPAPALAPPSCARRACAPAASLSRPPVPEARPPELPALLGSCAVRPSPRPELRACACAPARLRRQTLRYSVAQYSVRSPMSTMICELDVYYESMISELNVYYDL